MLSLPVLPTDNMQSKNRVIRSMPSFRVSDCFAHHTHLPAEFPEPKSSFLHNNQKLPLPPPPTALANYLFTAQDIQTSLRTSSRIFFISFFAMAPNTVRIYHYRFAGFYISKISRLKMCFIL